MNVKNQTQRAFAVALLFLVSTFMLPVKTNFAEAATLDEINGQIDKVSKGLDAKKGEVQTIQNQIDIIDGQTGKLQLEMQGTQEEIDRTTAQINSLKKKIVETETELKKQQKILSEYLRVIYEESNTSPMEEIASTDNFSDFVDKTEYLQTMQAKIKEAVNKVRKMKADLDTKKGDLDKKRASLAEMQKKQNLQKKSLDSQRALKDSLLAKANADAAGLQGKLNDLFVQKAAMSAQYGEAFVGGGSGYPYGSPPAGGLIDTPDPWGYLIGECTSYVAWKRASIGRPVPRAMGNARDWAGMAGGGPAPGAVAVFPYVGYYGHVAYVEAVYGNGTILISEYNWTPYSYSARVINPYNYGIVYIN